jgi:hypothetical protein
MRKIGFMAAVLTLLFAVQGNLSGAAAGVLKTQGAAYQGNAICGGTDVKTGRYLGTCGLDSAKKIGRANTECPKGSFLDVGTGYCYTCPRGFNRSGFGVDTPKACTRQISAQYKRATKVSSHKSCPNGTFKDSRNGGECWKCPSGYGRTMSAVTAWDACGKAFATARRAEFIDRVCPEGTITDPNGGCYTCPAGFRRTAAAVTGHNACFRDELMQSAEKHAPKHCGVGEIFDGIEGGTCWKCPEGSVRSIFGVNTNKACEFTNIRWESAKRTPNGLFGLPGGHEITAQVIKEGTRINAAIAKMSKESKLNSTEAEELKTKAWDLIRTAPEQSPILKAAVYDHVFDLIKKGAKTKPEKDMLNYLALYVQESRILAAKEMQLIWKSWQDGLAAIKATRSGTNAVNAYDMGVAPPDMRGLVGDVMMLAPGAAMVMTFIGASAAEAASTAIAELTAKFAVAVFPYRFRDATSMATAGRTAFQAVGMSGRLAGTATATTGSTAAASIGAFAGPLVILTASSVVFTIATDIAIERGKQEAIVHDALQVAQKPVNLSRLVKTEEGRTEVASNWGLMTQEPLPPNAGIWIKLMPRENTATVNVNGQTIVVDMPKGPTQDMVVVGNSSSGAAVNKAAQWAKIDGKARDVAVGSDGTTYVIGVNTTGGGYQIFKRATTDSKWTKIIGGATRIAVMGTQAWVVNANGAIYHQSGAKWRRVPGPVAQDIGASAKGVWIIDTNGKIHQRNGNGWQNVPGTAQRIDIDRDGRPWVVNAKGEIFVHDNSLKWQRVPGAAIDIAADIPGKAVAIDKQGNVFAFNSAKNNWDALVRDKDAQAVGAGGGAVWRVTTKNEIYRFQ